MLTALFTRDRRHAVARCRRPDRSRAGSARSQAHHDYADLPQVPASGEGFSQPQDADLILARIRPERPHAEKIKVSIIPAVFRVANGPVEKHNTFSAGVRRTG